MAQVGHEHNAHSIGETMLDRRKVLIGLAGLGTAAAGYGIVSSLGGQRKESVPSGNAPSNSSESKQSNVSEQTKGVSSEQAVKNIHNLTQSVDLYKDRPWADPHQLIDLTYEQLQDIAGVPFIAETSTKEGFAKVFAEKLELFFNAGQTLDDVQIARDKYGSQVGERDYLGNPLGEYDEKYVGPHYGDPMS